MEESEGSVWGRDGTVGPPIGSRKGVVDAPPDVPCIVRKLSRTMCDVFSCAQAFNARKQINKKEMILLCFIRTIIKVHDKDTRKFLWIGIGRKKKKPIGQHILKIDLWEYNFIRYFCV